MNISAILPQSLMDYPGKVSAVFFTIGCNFRCPYCYNTDLVLRKAKPLSEEKINSFLEERKEFLDAIIISGGEATLQEDIIPFAKKVKKYGFLLGIETNGSNPEVIKNMLKENLLDFIAMDIKSDLENYEKTVRVKIDIEKIKQSIKIVKESGLPYEFRTTVVPTLFNKEIAENIGKLLKGAKKLVLQQFVNENDMLDNTFKKIEPFKLSELDNFKKILEKYILEVDVRHT